MCGLVGIAGDTSSNRHKDVFTDLLIVDTIRGMHSTGVAFVPRFKIDKPSVLKCVGPATDLVTTKEYKDAMNRSMMCLLGHNRYATKGEINESNAHPFKFEHIVGAHNGTLDLSSQRKLFGNDKFGTDSEAVYSHLNEYGLRDTVDQLQGAWALTWYDFRDNSLNFLRNSKRPLHYAYSKDRCTIYWASEFFMLEFIISRYGLETDGKIYLVEEDKHIKWIIPFGVNEKIKGPSMEEMKALPEPPKSWLADWGEYSYGSTYRSGEKRSYLAKTNETKNTVTNLPVKVDESPFQTFDSTKRLDTTKFRPPYKRPDGTVINKETFNKYVADGCVFCDKHDIPWGKFMQPLLDDLDGRHVFICEDCYNDDDSYECLQWMIN